MFRILRNTFLTSRSGLIARNTSWLEDENMDVKVTAAHTDTPEALLCGTRISRQFWMRWRTCRLNIVKSSCSAKWKSFRTGRSLKYFHCQLARSCHANTAPSTRCAIH